MINNKYTLFLDILLTSQHLRKFYNINLFLATRNPRILKILIYYPEPCDSDFTAFWSDIIMNLGALNTTREPTFEEIKDAEGDLPNMLEYVFQFSGIKVLLRTEKRMPWN